MSSFLSRPFRHILGGRANEPETSQDFLRVLVDPPHANVDVVAVHGLNPFGKTNHAEATWTGGNNDMWLKDWLHISAPQARVLLFGYNSNAAFGTIKLGLRGQAINLLNRLAGKRKECPGRPLVFICHSLGGLLVKQALISAKGDTDYQEIPASTYGIAFFGTPHRGGNHAGIGAFAAGIAHAVLGNPGNGLVRTLKKNSDVLDGITEDFRPFLENFHFLSFFETKNFGSTRDLVVTKESATLGLTPDREKQLGLPADHGGICRFDSKDSDTYKQVEQNIVDMITAAATAPKTRNASDANIAHTSGIENETVQAGTANRSMTDGKANRTTQVGQDNSSETQGRGNTTTQVSMTAEEVKAHTEKVLNGVWK